MVGNEDTDILLFQLVDNRLNIFHGNGIDTGKGFVEHNELGADGQTAGYLGTPPLATRQLVAQVLAHLLQTKFGNEALQLLALVLLRRGSHLEHTAYVVLDRQLAEYRSLLCQIADTDLCPLIDGIVGNIEVVEINMSLIGRNQTRSHVESGRLTGTVWAQQTYDFALCHINRHMVDHRTLAILLHQVLGTQHHVVAREFRGRLLYFGRRLGGGIGSFGPMFE